MKLTFLGAGGAFTLENYHSNMLIEHEGKRLLIDAGTDIRFSLKKAGLGVKDLDAIYISHLHGDHMGGMEYIAFASHFIPPAKKIDLYGPADVLRGLWDSLKVTVTSIQNTGMNFEDYFNVHPLNYQQPFTWEPANLKFDMVRVPHIHDGFVQMWSYGLYFQANDKKVYISTDCQGINSLAIASADIVFHDCETSKYKSGVHTNYEDLKQDIPDKIRKNVWLYHYNDGEKPDAVADGFAGFVELGQTFEF